LSGMNNLLAWYWGCAGHATRSVIAVEIKQIDIGHRWAMVGSAMARRPSPEGPQQGRNNRRVGFSPPKHRAAMMDQVIRLAPSGRRWAEVQPSAAARTGHRRHGVPVGWASAHQNIGRR